MIRTIRRRALGAALASLALAAAILRMVGLLGSPVIVDGALLAVLVLAGAGLFLAVTDAPGPQYARTKAVRNVR